MKLSIFSKKSKAVCNLVLTGISVIVKKGVSPFNSDIRIKDEKDIRESQNNIRQTVITRLNTASTASQNIYRSLIVFAHLQLSL